MAETLISPGVLARENDNSFVSKRPVTVGAAIIGPTVKGPVEIPTVVTTYNEYVNKFGTTFTSGSSTNLKTYSYFTSIAAYNYFVNGGTSLLVSRVVSGSYLPASSSAINNSIATVNGNPATGSYTFTAANTGSAYRGINITIGDNTLSNTWSFAGYEGSTQYDNAADYVYFNTGSNWVQSLVNTINNWSELQQYITASFVGSTLILSGSAGNTLVNGATITTSSYMFDPGGLAATLGGATPSTTATAFVLETLALNVSVSK
jgi:hypothetical protein